MSRSTSSTHGSAPRTTPTALTPRSLVAELALAYVSRDRRAINIAFDLVADALEDNQVPQLVLGLLESLHGAAVDGQGCQSAVQRLQSRLEAAQHRALRAVAAAS